MPFFQGMCSICLENHEQLKHTDDDADDNVKYTTKLSAFIPELDWSKGYFLCESCIEKVNITYDFRNQCLRSFEIIRDEKGNAGNSNNDGSTIFNNLSNLNEGDVSRLSEINGEETVAAITKKNEENADIQTSSCNSLLNKKFKTNRLRNVNRKLLVKNSKYIQNGIDIKAPDVKNDIHDNEGQVKCFDCDNIFCDKDTLILHINTVHTANRNHESHKNNENFSSSITNHESSLDFEQSLKEFRCSRCSQLFPSAQEIEVHTCDKSKLDISDDDLKDDLTNNEDEICKPKAKRGRKPLEKQVHQCYICNHLFSTKYLLSRHIRNVHATEKLYNCDICGQKFASPVYLSAHKRYHSGERPHICSTCGKGFITTSDLYHHEKIHANKRSYKCDKCPKAFNTSSDLHKHNICVHLDRSEWKYVCSFCDKRFPLKTNLDTHVKIHTGEKNFACHMCDRRCINKSVLLRHIETHSNVRSFRCHVCKQEYKYQKTLNIHLTKAHGIGDAKVPERTKKYICHICPKSYYANNKLQKHIRTHTGERPFVCNICEKKFIDKSCLNQHMKSAHSILFGILNNECVNSN